MSELRKKVAVKDLQFGMYVFELDRPWTETPFTFQGFTLRNEQQLEILYGNWRQPDPDYVYWRDCRATVERHPWTGRRKRA